MQRRHPLLPALRIARVVSAFGVLTASTALAGGGDADRRVGLQLAAGHADSAAALVPGALAAARRIHAGAPAAYAAYVDSLAARFFDAGAGETGVRLLEHGIAVRDSALGSDDIALAAPLEVLATGYYAVGRVADAIAPLQRARAIYTAALGADDPATATCGYTLALVYYLLTRYDEAEAGLWAALAVQEAAADSLAVAETERMLGEVCREGNRYGEAEAHMLRALAIANAVLPDEDPARVTFLNSLAGYYRDQARYDEAEYLIEEAIDIRSRAGLEDQLAIPTLNLAEIYRYQGRYDDALPLYQRALALAQQYLTPLDVAEFHNQLAAVYSDSGDLEAASQQYELALAIVRDSPHASPQVVAQFEHDYGVLLFRRGKRAEGEAMLASAIARREAVFGPSHPLVAASLTELARQTMTTRGGREAAAEMLDRAIAMLDSSDAEPEAEADARAARAELFALDERRSAAIAGMSAAIDIVEALRPHRGGGAAERVTFMGRHRGYYEKITEWEVAAGEAAQALTYTERMRARTLVDRLAGSQVVADEGAANAVAARLRERHAELERRLEECQARARELRQAARPSRAQREDLARTEEECDHLVEDLQRARDRMERAAVAPGGGDTGDVMAMAARVTPSGGALLVYHIGAERSLLFLITADSERPRCVALTFRGEAAARMGLEGNPVTRAALTRVLTGFDENGRSVGLGVLRSLSEPPPGGADNPVAARARRDQEASLAMLFATLVPESVWRAIRPRGEVIVIADGPLFGLPFEALVTSLTADRSVMWIDDGPAIRYAPSIAMLDAIGRAPDAPAPQAPLVLSVCNPRFDPSAAAAAPASATWVARTRFGERGGSLAPLPGTERESESVVATFGANAVTVLRGEAATERAVRAAVAGKDVVHLATHGLVSLRRSDLLAALALTPASAADLDNDGFLQMFEIYRLPLTARLVVLSACESSYGRYYEGEGVMALSNGFHAAGAREVVATLWKVDDEASAVLMSGFLARVAAAWDNGGEVARALRDAKRAVRADGTRAHPFYWAAFAASGRP